MTQPLSFLARGWLCVALLWVVAFLNYLDRVMLMTMRASVTEAIPITDAQFGLLTSVFLWVYGVLSPFGGFLADRFGRSRVVVGSLCAWSAVTWLTGHARTYEELLLARAVMGISEACYIPAAMALVMDYHRGPTRSLANGLHLSGTSVGSGLGGLGGWLAERHDWGYPFRLFGALGVGYCLVLVLCLRDAPRAESPASNETSATMEGKLAPALKDLFNGSFFLALLFWGLLGLAGWGILGWMPTFFMEQFRLRQGAAGFSATGYLQAAAVAGVILGGALTDWRSRADERRRITITALGLCLAAPGIMLAANTRLVAVAVGGLILYGLMRSLADANMMPILCLICDPRCRATGYGILNFFGCVVGGLTIYAGGLLRDARVSVSRMFEFAAASLVAAAILLLFAKPRTAAAGARRAPGPEAAMFPEETCKRELNGAPARGKVDAIDT